MKLGRWSVILSSILPMYMFSSAILINTLSFKLGLFPFLSLLVHLCMSEADSGEGAGVAHSNHFLDRWRHAYGVNLRETQQTSKLNINSIKINVNDTVLFFNEKVPRNFWRIAIVSEYYLVEILK